MVQDIVPVARYKISQAIPDSKFCILRIFLLPRMSFSE